jgi:hypothetical protein
MGIPPFKSEILLVFFVMIAQIGYSQNKDRTIISNGYFSSDLQGEWMIGNLMTGDFQSRDYQLNNGFLHHSAIRHSTAVVGTNDLFLDAFPNPTVGLIHIRHSCVSPITIDIYDLLGQEQLVFKEIEQETTLDIGQLPSGPYIINYRARDRVLGSLLLFRMQ